MHNDVLLTCDVQVAVFCLAAGYPRMRTNCFEKIAMHMQEIAETTMGDDGKSRREQIVDVLSKMITWRMLPFAVVMVLRTAVVSVVRSLWSLLRGRGVRGRGLPAKGLDVLGVHLSRASLKRALLVASVAFARLWQQSRMVAIRSVLMSFRIALAALFSHSQLETK